MGAVVSRVEPGSIAARYGFLEKDEIITINGQLLRDVIDYYFVTSDDKLEINYVRDGFPHTTVIHKNMDESLGLDFESEVFDGIMKCRYNCLFCFVNQMPPKMRNTLYLKDDDYRLSFLHGSYITLTDLAEVDLRRITGLRLSPLYVSVHATDPDVRAKMMGNPSAGNILKLLNKLKTHDIQCHTQIVVVPGVNDGKVLKNTLQDLLNLYPTVKSVAIVPVGLTGYRRNQPKIQPFRKVDAQHVYDLVSKFQKRAESRFRFPLFYLADEFYLMMDMEFPRHAHYGYFEQMGNGVGLSRKMLTDFNRRKRYFPKELSEKRTIWAVTGVLGEKVLKPLIEELNRVENLEIKLVPVENDFFGKNVTVTGLLTGRDILRELKKRAKSEELPNEILIPDILIRDGIFLDDMSIQRMETGIKTSVRVVSTDAQGLIDGALGQWKKTDFNRRDSVEIALTPSRKISRPQPYNPRGKNEQIDVPEEEMPAAPEEDRKLIEIEKPKHFKPKGKYRRTKNNGKNRNFSNNRGAKDSPITTQSKTDNGEKDSSANSKKSDVTEETMPVLKEHTVEENKQNEGEKPKRKRNYRRKYTQTRRQTSV